MQALGYLQIGPRLLIQGKYSGRVRSIAAAHFRDLARCLNGLKQSIFLNLIYNKSFSNSKSGPRPAAEDQSKNHATSPGILPLNSSSSRALEHNSTCNTTTSNTLRRIHISKNASSSVSTLEYPSEQIVALCQCLRDQPPGKRHMDEKWSRPQR